MASSAPFDAAAVITLDADRLDAYRVAREFDSFACRALPRRGCASLRDQLGRASCSIVLNIAEGCGRLDVALSRGLVSAAAHRHGRGLLARIVQMLTRLAQRMRE